MTAPAYRDSTFRRIATSPDITPDQTYTIELLIDAVGYDFRDNKWHLDSFDSRVDERRAPQYVPRFEPARLEEAYQLLSLRSRLSLQQVISIKQVVDLSPLTDFDQLTGLSLGQKPHHRCQADRGYVPARSVVP